MMVATIALEEVGSRYAPPSLRRSARPGMWMMIIIIAVITTIVIIIAFIVVIVANL